MQEVWKYPVYTGLQISMPKGSQILKVSYQGIAICIWVLVDPEAEHELRSFYVSPTGSPIPNNCAENYIGTAFQCNDELVWHVFEEIT